MPRPTSPPACLAGLGLIQAPRSGLGDDLAQGLLVEVLPDYCARPMSLALVYAKRRNQRMRVRVVMDWLTVVAGDYANR